MSIFFPHAYKIELKYHEKYIYITGLFFLSLNQKDIYFFVSLLLPFFPRVQSHKYSTFVFEYQSNHTLYKIYAHMHISKSISLGCGAKFSKQKINFSFFKLLPFFVLISPYFFFMGKNPCVVYLNLCSKPNVECWNNIQKRYLMNQFRSNLYYSSK